MIYIDTGSCDVYYYFGCDHYFADKKTFDDTVFLFWRTSPTIMVVKYQNVAEEINIPYVKEHNINIVRRMSGGGTIYTDMGGWQFTFIDKNTENVIEFRRYISPVIDALASFGIKAEFNGRNDLCINGKKISGNAQYRLGNSIIHHGSLLFNTDIESMVNATTVDSYKIISKSIKSIRDRVANISEYTVDSKGQSIDIQPEDFKEAMVSSILSGAKRSEVYDITHEDNVCIKALADSKFNNWESIYGSNPRFNIERSARFEGGKIVFKLDVIHGKIESASVYGDFFSILDAADITAALKGCAYSREAVYDAFVRNGMKDAIYKISIEDIAEMIAD